MRKRVLPTASLAVVAIAFLAGAGCAREVSVAEVTADPESFYGKVVVVEGLASDGYGVAGYGLYELRDATGSIRVVSKSGIPDNGVVLRVRGRVNAPIELGVVRIGTHIAEDSREAP